MEQSREYDNIYILASVEKSTEESSTTISPQQNKSTPFLFIKCFKWNQSFIKPKYEQFFDYESKDFLYKEFKVYNKGTIYDNFTTIELKENEIIGNNDKMSMLRGRDYLKENITFEIDELGNYIMHHNSYAYISMQFLNSECDLTNLKSGNEVKIGKCILKVEMIKLSENNVQIEKMYSYQNNYEKDKICRICLRNDKEDTFISICNCKGTLKYTHSECMRLWIESKCKKETHYYNPCVCSININKFFCEICKMPFPLGVYLNQNKFFYIIKEFENYKRFIIFKTKHFDDEGKSNSIEFIFVKLDNYYKNEITIGRSKDSIIHLCNDSVSRQHCLISYDEKANNIKIKDRKSKFGTLIKMEDDIILNKQLNNITIQKGNTVYNISYCII